MSTVNNKKGSKNASPGLELSPQLNEKTKRKAAKRPISPLEK
jgi:hypothetical protein